MSKIQKDIYTSIKNTLLKTCEFGNRPVQQNFILCIHTMDWQLSLKIFYVIHDKHHQ
jgi:hypothetical protein